MLKPIIILVISFSLIFEFINGFHDTANAIATSVYTRALSAKYAIMLAAAMNLLSFKVSLCFLNRVKVIDFLAVPESSCNNDKT